jgi:hypothetical protein
VSGLGSLFSTMFGRVPEAAYEPETLPAPPPAVQIEVIQRLNVEIARAVEAADEQSGEDTLAEVDLAFGRFLTAKATGDSEGILDSLGYLVVAAITAGLITRGDVFNDVLDDNVAELSDALDEGEGNVRGESTEQDETSDHGC